MFIDGVAYPQPPMGRNIAEPVITALKALAELQIDDRRRPQEGVFKVRDAEGLTTLFTIRTSGTTAGERLSLSANEKGRWDRSLEQLGLAADQLAALKDAIQSNQGVVLVATPRGSGRTTTLYSLLRTHDAFVNSVQTVEINPQAEIEGVTVNRFDPRAPDASMAKLINSVFLKDPNIVMVAQIVDAPSGEVIAKYGEIEHRVYVGMNAFDTMAGLEQWMQLVSNKRLAKKQHKPGFFRGAPDLAIEVLSPGDSAEEVDEKIQEWLAAGVRLLWIVNPKAQTISVYRPGGLSVLRRGDTLSGEDVVPNFQCLVSAIVD